MESFINKILKEFTWRSEEGYPDWSKQQHIDILKEILQEQYNKEFIEEFINNIINKSSLKERSVFEKKYPYGTLFIISSTGKKQLIKNAADSSINNVQWNGIFTKIKQPTNNKKVIHCIRQQDKQNTKQFWVKDEKNNIIHIKGRGEIIKTWFKRASKNYKDINFNDVNTLETAAIIGLYLDGEKWLEKLNNIQDDRSSENVVKQFINVVQKVLSNGQDWAKNDIEKKIVDAPLNQLVLLCSLAAGMTKFAKDKAIFSKFNFIHKQINKYYQAEEENANIKSDGSKSNTADVILFLSDSVKDFLSNMSSENVSFDNSGLCQLDSGDQFYQISLKKGKEKAQLGKITTLIKQKFDLQSNDDVAFLLTHESLIKDKLQLNEDFTDIWQQGKKTLQKVGKKVFHLIDTIKNKLFLFWKTITKQLDKYWKKSEQEVEKKFLKYFSKQISIQEARSKLSLNDAINYLVKEQNYKVLQQFYQQLNQDIEEILDICKQKNYIQCSIKGNIKLQVPKKFDKDLILKILANYRAIKAIKKMLKNDVGDSKTASEVFDLLIDLEKEMIFGKTSLPLYKVYGLNSDGSGTAYEYYNSGENFKQKRKSEFKNINKQLIMILVLSEQSDGYLAITTYTLSHIEDGELMYNVIQYRTNQRNTPSFTVEGSKVIPWSKLQKNVNK